MRLRFTVGYILSTAWLLVYQSDELGLHVTCFETKPTTLRVMKSIAFVDENNGTKMLSVAILLATIASYCDRILV